MSIWKSDVLENNDKLFLEVDEFFDNIENIEYLECRDGQRSMAYSVIDCINDKHILLIEAGVGIGKSYAYLIPLIQSIKDDSKFEGFIVATSTIALQEQLLKDVDTVIDMLGIDPNTIEVSLAKGKNNYICKKRLDEFIKSKDGKKYKYILDEVLKSDSVDRKDFEEISDYLWKKFNVRNCSMAKCPYYADCKITLEKNNFENSKIIITNQDLLISDLKKDEENRLFKGEKVVVVDEAHNLEEKIRNSYVIGLEMRIIESLLYRVYASISDYDEDIMPPSSVFEELREFFTRLRSSGKYEIKKVDENIDNFVNCGRVKFSISIKVREVINKLIKSLSDIIDEINEKNKFDEYKVDKKALLQLKDLIDVLKDMLLEDKSKNIYYLDFQDPNGNYLRISYTPKKMYELSAGLFSKIRAGVVLTSATLTLEKNNYEHFSNSLGLDKVVGKSVLKEFSQDSPFDYKNNALLYCPKDVISFKEKELYLNDITERIKELIEITNGKTLVLFTSKNDMNYVYEHIGTENFDFSIYIQKDNANMKKLKEKFEEDIQSCLFATGSFYEGIDIKGSSLSQVIIAKLPFAVVDPVMDYKATKFKDGFLEVYLPDMITKLKQGTGRAIRSSSDTAIISILDSRIHNYNDRYQNMIFDSLPFSNITDNIEEVKKFAHEKIK